MSDVTGPRLTNAGELRELGMSLLASHFVRRSRSPASIINMAATLIHGVPPNAHNLQKALDAMMDGGEAHALFQACRALAGGPLKNAE